MNDFYRCDLETMTWAQIPGIGTVPTPRYFHSCAVHNGSMYVFGGYNGSDRLCDFFEHNFETGVWTELVIAVMRGGDSFMARLQVVLVIPYSLFFLVLRGTMRAVKWGGLFLKSVFFHVMGLCRGVSPCFMYFLSAEGIVHGTVAGEARGVFYHV